MKLLLGVAVALAAVRGCGAAPRPAPAKADPIVLTVLGGKEDRKNVLVRTLVPPQAIGDATDVRVRAEDGAMLLGQVTPARMFAIGRKDSAADGATQPELVFVIPELKAGETKTYKVLTTFAVDGTPARFSWKETRGESEELSFQKPILKYMCAPLDDSSKEARERTYKVFHHVYAPDGAALLTKGAGGHYTHHRGLFFAFNRVSYGNKKADVWHCTGDAFQSHEETLERTAGTLLGRHRVRIGWHGPGKETFAEEQRELTAFRMPDAHLIEFASEVRTKVGPVRLDGDPQHAGFHFRASNEVAEQANAKKPKTYFLRPDGQGKVGEERNWDPKSRKGPTNLPWNAMCIEVGGKRYTVVYLDHPKNPKEARISERIYGRFGNYFEYDLTEQRPLQVQYRIWVQPGEMTVAQCEALSRDFVDPVRVEVR